MGGYFARIDGAETASGDGENGAAVASVPGTEGIKPDAAPSRDEQIRTALLLGEHPHKVACRFRIRRERAAAIDHQLAIAAAQRGRLALTQMEPTE